MSTGMLTTFEPRLPTQQQARNQSLFTAGKPSAKGLPSTTQVRLSPSRAKKLLPVATPTQHLVVLPPGLSVSFSFFLLGLGVTL